MAMPGIGIVEAITGSFAKLLSIEAIKHLSFKGLIVSALTLIVPPILYNAFVRILKEVMEYTMTLVNGSGAMSGVIVELTSLGAWIADKISLIEAMSIFLSAVGLKFVLSFFRR